MWAADLVDRAALQPGERVLDVACGTGVVARVAAERVGSTGRVAALDVNSGMLAVARSLPAVTGAPVEWHEGSALALPFPDAAFDVAFCQLGLQFFPDRPKALREIRRVLVPDRQARTERLRPDRAQPRDPRARQCAGCTRSPRCVGGQNAQSTRSLTASELCTLVAGAGFRDVVLSHSHEDGAIPLRHWTTSGFNSRQRRWRR